MNPWAYKIDYDKEIAGDEREIAWLSGDFAKALAAKIEDQLARAADEDRHYWLHGNSLGDVLYFAPELAELSGIPRDDLRAYYHGSDSGPGWEEREKEIEKFWGPSRDDDTRTYYALRDKYGDLLGTTVYRETGKFGRADRLRLAKAALSRHKRNKAKHGGK